MRWEEKHKQGDSSRQFFAFCYTTSQSQNKTKKNKNLNISQAKSVMDSFKVAFQKISGVVVQKSARNEPKTQTAALCANECAWRVFDTQQNKL